MIYFHRTNVSPIPNEANSVFTSIALSKFSPNIFFFLFSFQLPFALLVLRMFPLFLLWVILGFKKIWEENVPRWFTKKKYRDLLTSCPNFDTFSQWTFSIHNLLTRIQCQHVLIAAFCCLFDHVELPVLSGVISNPSRVVPVSCGQQKRKLNKCPKEAGTEEQS